MEFKSFSNQSIVMALLAFGKFKRYNNPGALLYIPDRVYRDVRFPFKEGEPVKITIENGRVVETRVSLQELEENPEGQRLLSRIQREKNRQTGTYKLHFEYSVST